MSGISQSRVMRLHKPEVPLFSDRDYVCFDANALKGDLQLTVAELAEVCPNPRVKLVLEAVADELRKGYDSKNLREHREEMRRAGFRAHSGGFNDKWYLIALMLLVFLDNGFRIERKDK